MTQTDSQQQKNNSSQNTELNFIFNFIDNLYTEAGLDNGLPEEVIEAQKLELFNLIIEKIGVKVLSELTDEDREEYMDKFSKVMDDGNVDNDKLNEILNFLYEKKLNLNSIMENVFSEVKDIYMSNKRLADDYFETLSNKDD